MTALYHHFRFSCSPKSQPICTTTFYTDRLTRKILMLLFNFVFFFFVKINVCMELLTFYRSFYFIYGFADFTAFIEIFPVTSINIKIENSQTLQVIAYLFEPTYDQRYAFVMYETQGCNSAHIITRLLSHRLQASH